MNVLRLIIAVSVIAMLILYAVGSNVVAPYVLVFIVYWGYGAQLSVNASATSDFLGHQERRYQLRNAVHGH